MDNFDKTLCSIILSAFMNGVNIAGLVINCVFFSLAWIVVFSIFIVYFSYSLYSSVKNIRNY